jgi:hypothetical protein
MCHGVYRGPADCQISENIVLTDQFTQSEPFLNFNECGIQNVADMMPPLRPKDGFAIRGSSSAADAPLT